MNRSEEARFIEKQGDGQKLGQHHPDDEKKTAAKVENKVIPGHIHTNRQGKTQNYDVDRSDTHTRKVVQPLHGFLLSLAVTSVCGILCAFMPSVAVFFGPALLIACMLVTVLICETKARPYWIAALDTLSRGRLAAMLAAVALYPPLSLDQVRFFMGHPLAMVAEDAPPGLPTAFAFAMLCAVQTGIATVLALEAIPPRRLTAFILGMASILPSGLARQLRRRVAEAERRISITK